jgi:DNA ligase-associated metallophosphoesterase
MNRFEFHGIPLVLSPDGAVFLTKTSTLVAADVHLGKSAAFRAHGLPIPEGDTARDLSRLIELARLHGAAELVIAGDLFHGPSGITPEIEDELLRFTEVLQIPLHLVGGNHDARIKRLPGGIVSVPLFDRGGIRIIHDPADAGPEGMHLAGHWHPIAKIPDGKRTSLRMPCFLLRRNTLVVPAFGSFTGGAVVRPESGDRIFVTLRENVVEVPPDLWTKNPVAKPK